MARREPSEAKLAIVGGVLFTAVEQLRMVAPYGGFPWGAVAFSQVDGPLLRAASLGGTVLVTVVVAVGAAIQGPERYVVSCGGPASSLPLELLQESVGPELLEMSQELASIFKLGGGNE